MKAQTYIIIPTEKFNKELHQQVLYIAMQFSQEKAIQVKEKNQKFYFESYGPSIYGDYT